MNMCEKSEELLDLLYEEGEPEARARVESHVAGCDSCRQELADLSSVRRRLPEWKAPVRREGPARRAAWPGRLVAAAAVLLALGGAFRLLGGSLSLRDGEMRISWGAPRGGEAEVGTLLSAAEERHRRDIEALRASLVRAPRGGSLAAGEEALLRRVKEMIDRSEIRQARAFEAGLADLAAQTEQRRRLDLASVSAGFSYLDGKRGQQAARTTELMGYLMQASDQK